MDPLPGDFLAVPIMYDRSVASNVFGTTQPGSGAFAVMPAVLHVNDVRAACANILGDERYERNIPSTGCSVLATQ